MPTTYTHDYFGKRVYQMLPQEIRKIVRAHGELYRIGLHGPDILFYYMLSSNPVSRHGVKMHGEKAEAFFAVNCRQIRENKDEELLAYVLGFACHYILDSASHPFVNRMADGGVISHTLLEKELDRYLMEATGKDPLRYHPSDAVTASWKNARVIHRAIPRISTLNIFLAMKCMKKITNFMVCRRGGRKREWMGAIAGIAGKHNAKRLSDFFIRQKAAPEAEIPVKKLVHIFEDAVPEAAYELNLLYRIAWGVENGMKLSGRWDMDYRGNRR